MEEEKKKNKRTFYLTIGLCLVLVVAFIFLSSYAYWRLSDHQSGTNLVIGGCLEIQFEEPGVTGFTLEDAWPTEDAEGILQDGYSFNIVNTCKKEVNYQIVLESIGVPDPSKKMKPDYIKLQLDNGAIVKYTDLEQVADDTNPDLDYEIYQTRQMLAGTVAAATDNEYGVNHHNVKIWMNIDADLDARGQQFNSRVKVYAGQGIPEPEYAITPESCFGFDASTGTITSYDWECGTDVVFPATIGGVPVKIIPDGLLQYYQSGYNLTYLDLSKMTFLESIGEEAFEMYTSSSPLVFPENLKSIGKWSFRLYNGPEVVLNDKLETIGEHAFRAYSGTGKNLKIPSTMREIGSYAFQLFDGSNLIIEAGTQELTIGNYAFYSYHGNDQILTIPGNVKNTGAYAFNGFNGKNLILSEGIEEIGNASFGSYRGETNPLVLPNSLLRIKEYGFSGYRGSSLTLPPNLERLEDNAFYNYNGSTITIPASIRYIGNSVFFTYSNYQNNNVYNMETTEEFFNENVEHYAYWYGGATPVWSNN